MTEIGFYHLQRQSLMEALPKLLERVLAAGHRVLLRVPNEAETDRLNIALWTYSEGSFLPHGTVKEGFEAEQPIYLTPRDENPNGAEILCQVGGAEFADMPSFKRILDLFDGNDPDALSAARDRWKRYKASGHEITYWVQKPEGGWQKKA